MLRFAMCAVAVAAAVTLASGLTALAQAAPGEATIHVATNGNDAWSGKLAAPNDAKTDGPVATLERARALVREIKMKDGLTKGGIRVVIHGGAYLRDGVLELVEEDSGSADAPIIYAAAPGEEVRLVGGKVVANWQPVTDAKVLERIDEAARGNVLQADLKACGVTEFGAPDGGGMELFFQDKPMLVSRWPNEGFVRIVDIVEKDGHEIHGAPGSKVGKFVYDGDRPKRWVGEKDGWLHGYWFWDWSDQRQKIAAIDTQNSVITLAEPAHGYGYRKGQWYYAFNMLCELDSPGEWHLDRETGILYFWPPAPIDAGQAVVSVQETAVKMKGASFVTLRGLTIEAYRGTPVTVSGGEQNRIAASVIRNCGGNAVSLGDGRENGVVGCDIYQMGRGGISLYGGDRTALTPAGLFADNNNIHEYGRWARMYQAGISMGGVGNRATHNLIHHAPHMAIQFGGNDHLIEFNEIHNVCQESNDAGAMYAGRDWTMRGTMIRYNYLHRINGFEGKGCVGVYLDDMYCGTNVFGNVFYKVTMASFIGGGRDNITENCIFVECKPALHIDARALGWAHGHADGWVQECKDKGTVCGMAYNKPPYSERYPVLVGLIEDEPNAPKGNVIARNICVGGTWDTSIEDKAKPLVTFTDNLVNEDPHFVDAAKLDFRLKDDSPAFKLGFKPIPIEQIGLYQDELRASWPVEHPVTETP